MHFVAVLGVADSVAIRARLSRFDGIGSLSFRPAPPQADGVIPHEGAIEFLNFGHEVGIKPSDLDSGRTKPQVLLVMVSFGRAKVALGGGQNGSRGEECTTEDIMEGGWVYTGHNLEV